MCGGIVLEEALDLSFDRLLMMMMIIDPERLQMTIRRMRIACWIPKATKTHLEYLLPFRCNNGCGIRL